MTNVLFLIEKPEGNLPCNVFAFFPDDQDSTADKNIFSCYAHIGQHSGCHIDYAKECKEANFNQYNDLLEELLQIGYNNLNILNKQTFEYHRQPTPFELKQGYGATHYRDFTAAQIGIGKRGYIKKWFVADDGLRYYR